MGSLRESGIFTQPFYPQKSGKNNHQTIPKQGDFVNPLPSRL